jgi:ketosteroid isomerase-like protein
MNRDLADGIIYPPGAPPMLGQKAIRTFWRTIAIRGMKEIDLKLMDLEYSGDLLIAKGKYVMTDKEKAILDIGKFIAIYRKKKIYGVFKQIYSTQAWRHDHQLKYLTI